MRHPTVLDWIIFELLLIGIMVCIGIEAYSVYLDHKEPPRIVVTGNMTVEGDGIEFGGNAELVLIGDMTFKKSEKDGTPKMEKTELQDIDAH